MKVFHDLVWPDYRKARPVITDFVFQEWHTQRAQVVEKREDRRAIRSVGPLSGGWPTILITYIVTVMTDRGHEVQITVSEDTYQLIKPRDKVVISYRFGRWTGALRGRLAR